MSAPSSLREPRPLAVLGLLAALIFSRGLHAEDRWRWTLSLENGSPSGWVQVRENAIEGTRLGFADDLGVSGMSGLRIGAVKSSSARSEWHLALATYVLDGTTHLDVPINFNGATIAPGRLRTATDGTHFLQFDAAYWRRFARFGNGGGLWGSVGTTVVLLNFTLHGTVTADSVGKETRETFYVQELPVPVLGLHLRYPLAGSLSLVASGSLGRLPRVDSLRNEGGSVRLKQTNDELSLGLTGRAGQRWQWQLSLFDRHYLQDEQSGEDSNVIHLREHGLMLGFSQTARRALP